MLSKNLTRELLFYNELDLLCMERVVPLIMIWCYGHMTNSVTYNAKATSFMKYTNEIWMDKISMWCTGSCNIPHVGQNTNAAIESYHSNLKSILKSVKERFNARHMDWLIYHLIGEVVIHYWYDVQCKAFGFIRNRNQEGIVASAIIQADAKPISNVLICIDDDVAYVGSVNNRPKYGPSIPPIQSGHSANVLLLPKK